MNVIELCEKYCSALGKKDLDGIRAVFTPDAIIKAPISGATSVEQFHSYLFSKTKKSVAKFPNVLHTREKSAATTMQFRFVLSIPDGQVTVLDGVAVFEVDEGARKFRGLSIIYDTTDLRRLMEEASIAPPQTATGS